jgi:hypothetical protein
VAKAAAVIAYAKNENSMRFMRDIISFPPAKRNRANCAIAARTAIVISPSRHVSTATQPCPTISHPSNNHNSTILRVEYKNDTISTKPSYISDSPTPTDTQKQFNLNHIKEGAANLPLETKFATLVIRQRIW